MARRNNARPDMTAAPDWGAGNGRVVSARPRGRAARPAGAPASARWARLALATLLLSAGLSAQVTVLLREVCSREVGVHVGGVQVPTVREVASREATALIGGVPPGPLMPQVVSREVALCTATAELPAMVTPLIVTTDPTGATALLDWCGYNEILQRDVVRYEIYVADEPFDSVTGLTPAAVVPAETCQWVVDGLTPWQDHAFAVVAVDALGQSLATVRYAASYPVCREVSSREVGLSVGAGDPFVSRQALSRESSLVLADAAPPAAVTELILAASPDGSAVTLDWEGYNEARERDVVRYDIYLSGSGFDDVAGMTPYRSVPAESRRLTLAGLPPGQDHCFAVVAVDALGNFDPAVRYSAAYVLFPEVVSREVSLHVGGREAPAFPEAVSREVSCVVPDEAVPAPVTGVDSGFTAVTSTRAYGAIDLAWPQYHETAQRDVVRYRVYAAPAFFDDVSAMAPHRFASAEALSFTVTGLTGDAIHYVAVVAEDALGQWNPAVRAISALASVSALGEVRHLAVESFADRLRFTWLPPENAEVFLDHYRVYVGEAAVPVVLPSTATTHEVDGLAPAHGYTFRIATVDRLDHETDGVSALGATWLANPAGLRTRGYDGIARLVWDPVAPASLLRHYAVYLDTAPFTSVAGRTPVATTAATRLDLTGLTNGVPYHTAVTAVNLSLGEDPAVTTAAVTPEPVPPVQYADLGTADVTAPSHAWVGAAVTVAWAVTNHGPGVTGNGEPDGTVDAWIDRLILSRDAIVGNLDDLVLADVLHVGALAPGATAPGSWTGPLPAGVTGEFQVFVRADHTDLVAESPDQATNLATADGTLRVEAVPPPDLVAESLTPAVVEAAFGDTIAVEWVVRHLGALPLAVTWQDAVWLSRDANLSPAEDYALGTFTPAAEALDPDEPYLASRAVALPLDGSVSAGLWYLILVTDADGAVSEADEGNNLLVSVAIDLSLPSLPDLTVAVVAAPAAVLSESWFEVRLRSENRGLAAAAVPFGWEDRLLLSTDAALGDDRLLSTMAVPGPLPAPPGDAGFERTLTVRAPLTAGTYWLMAQTDVGGRVEELNEGNNLGVAAVPLQVESAYAATVSAGLDVAGLGTPVPLNGRAWLFGSGQPAARVLVNLHIVVRGVTRVISALTDDQGEFHTTWTPLANEGGHYTVGACHPGQSQAPVQDAFDLVGLALDALTPPPTVVVGEVAKAVAMVLRNRGDAPVSAVSVAVLAAPVEVDAGIDPEALGALPGQGAAGVTLWLSASAVPPVAATVTLRLSSLETGATDVVVPIAVIQPDPDLVVTPAEAVAAMLAGQSRTVHLEVSNVGAAPALEVRVSLPAAPWLKLGTPPLFGPLEPGATAPVDLILQPDATLPLGPYRGQIVLIPANGPERRVPFTFRHVSEATGSLTITAVDEHTYYSPGAPRLAGATVVVKDAYDDDPVATAVTDADGIAVFPLLPEDYYQIEVSAVDHAGYRGVVFVSAAVANEETVFLSRQTVRYVWTVVPTEVEDVSEIIIEAVFETNVPAPVVTIEPTILDLAGLDAVGQSRTVNLTVRNHGWIAAQGAHFSIGEHPWYTITPLLADLGTLPARSSLVVPVTMTRIAVPEKGAKADVSCSLPVSVLYSFVCGPWSVSGSADVHVSNIGASCPGGIVGGGGGGGGGGSVSGSGTVAAGTSICDECVQKRLGELVNCVIGFIPGLDCGSGLGSCLGGPPPGGSWPSHLVNCLYAGVGCLADLGIPGKVFDAVRCFCSLKHACDGLPGHPPAADEFCDLANFRWPSSWWFKGVTPDGSGAGKGLDDYDAAVALLQRRVLQMMSQLDWILEVLGDGAWLHPDGAVDLEAFFGRFLEATAETSDEGRRLSSAEGAALAVGVLPAGVDPAMVARFVARWNRSLDYWDAGILNSADVPAGASLDFIALDRLQARVDLHSQALAEVTADGYDSLADAMEAARVEVMAALTSELDGGGVCARVRLQLNQRAVQTRDAFEATLVLENRVGTTLEAVGVTVQVFDAAGQPVTDRFAVRDPILTDIGAVDGTGQVPPFGSARAVWTLIPTTDAAPSGPTVYYVGGTLQYRDGGVVVSTAMTPAPITVYPQPELELAYYHQRDVLGDDPWTEGVIEPSVPYELAVMVRNRGAGAARNLRLESAQPAIIDNEKGLLIGFQILATEVAGEPLQPSLTADFGEVAPGDIEIGRWWMTSTMQGLFVEYSATFRHLDPWNDDRLSIIKSVAIHELIHTVRADGALDDGKPDFLVNAVNDSLDLPDALHLSDGTVLPVGLAAGVSHDGPVMPGHRVITLQAAMGPGWTYLRTDDPGGAEYRLVRVQRHHPGGSTSDLPMENAWQTDRTFLGLGLRPRLENRLHLLDDGSTGTYTLFYQSRDQAGPRVLAFESPGDYPVVDPVDSLDITFSEPVDPASLSLAAMALRRDGGPDLLAGVATLTQLAPAVFRLGGLTTLTTAGGAYHLDVAQDGITDLAGNPGSGVAVLSWTTLGEAPLVLAISGVDTPLRNAPVGALGVVFSEALEAGSFGLEDITLRRDGDPVPWGGPVALGDLGDGQFRLDGLAASTAPDGRYEVSIDATGVRDAGGTAGAGMRSLSWTMDATPPTVVSLTPEPFPGVSAEPVSAVVVVFSEPIEPLSLTPAVLSLRRDGGADLIDAAVEVVAETPTRFRVAGLSAAAEGAYVFTVDLSAVRDLAGNPGDGLSEVPWRLDTTPPAPPAGLAVVPDTGLSDSDGITNTPVLTVHAALAEAGLTVRLHDETAARPLGAVVVAGTAFAHQADLVNPGVHRLRLTAIDAAGNAAAAFFDVFVDPLPPEVVGLADQAAPQRQVTWTWGAADADSQIRWRARVDTDPSGIPAGAYDSTTSASQDDGDGRHYIHVQAIDRAGNASPVTTVWALLDNTPPAAPVVAGTAVDHTGRPAWSWSSGGLDGAGTYRWRLDNDDLETDATLTAATAWTPTAALAEGVHTFYVQERDAAGNWSPAGGFECLVDAWVTVTFQVAGPVPGGHLEGPPVQVIAHGQDSQPVTAVAAPGAVFESWDDASPDAAENPRTARAVSADLVLTARFRAAGPAPSLEGEFLATIDTLGAAQGRAWWNLTGTTTTTAAGAPLTLRMIHDARGRLSGLATYALDPGTVLTMPIRGGVRGARGAIVLNGALQGNDRARAVAVAFTLDLAVDAPARMLRGYLTGSLRNGAAVTRLAREPIAMPIPAPMDGTWTLRLQLTEDAGAIGGTALLRLSNGDTWPGRVSGSALGEAVAIVVLADAADPLAQAITIRARVVPLEGGWARLEALSAVGFGQILEW